MTATGKLTFDVLIEIPKGSRNKYEYDFDLKKIRYKSFYYLIHSKEIISTEVVTFPTQPKWGYSANRPSKLEFGKQA